MQSSWQIRVVKSLWQALVLVGGFAPPWKIFSRPKRIFRIRRERQHVCSQ